VPLRAVQTWDDGWQTRAGRYTVEAAHSLDDRRVSSHLDI
jgi:beta-glucosidase